MQRRTFIQSTAASVAAMHFGAPRAAAFRQPQKLDALVWDAMGELREEYDAALIRDMLGSGMDAITITLCDPKPEGAEALELAVDSLLQHDRYLASHPQFFLKATSVADVDRAAPRGEDGGLLPVSEHRAVGKDLDRVDLFHRMGLRSCQLTYNTRNLAGVGCWEEGGVTVRPRAHRAHERPPPAHRPSHANMQTMAETVAASRALVIVCTPPAWPCTRTGATPPTRTSAVASRVAVGICQMRPFLTTKKKDNLHAYFDHLMHAVRIVGVEHVCIGSDRDHRVITLTPEYRPS